MADTHEELEITETDKAIAEAEAELAAGGRLRDARMVIAELREKYFGKTKRSGRFASLILLHRHCAAIGSQISINRASRFAFGYQ